MTPDLTRFLAGGYLFLSGSLRLSVALHRTGDARIKGILRALLPLGALALGGLLIELGVIE